MSTTETASPPAASSSHRERQFDLHVVSEAGLLQQVIVHTPGHEMELVSPDNRLDLLFEDILFVGHAREEHLRMCRIFKKMVGRPDTVIQLGQLLRETFQAEDARHDFVERLCRTLPESNLRAAEDELKQLPPSELFQFALAGKTTLPVSMQPLPNLLFTRDLAAVVHDHIIVSHPATAARSRESLLLSVMLHHHPAFAHCRDRIIELPAGVTFEGGDLLVADEKLVLIGHSERTSFSGVMAVAHELFQRTPVEHILAVDLPKRRFCMHLDTVFTFAAPDTCVVFPPLLTSGNNYGYAVHLTPHEATGTFLTDMRPNFRKALRELTAHDLTFIPCGGNDPLHQRREQWTDGANLFAIAPGVVVGYERNSRTFGQLRDHGYRTVTAQGFLSYYKESDYTPDEKVAVKLEGHELSRGRGGPRCMTLPLARQQ